MKNLYLVVLCSVFFSSKAQVFNITTYGAIGDSVTMNTAAIQAAIDSCHNAGGGFVEVPAGIFLTATVYLKSNVIIRLDQGAVIKGSPTIADYPDVVPAIRSYADNYPQKSVFYAENQNNIGIVGQGTFNGNGYSTDFLTDRNHSPLGFRFISCSNVIYDGVTLLNSGFWMMHNFNIDTLTIKNLRIVNQDWGNNDGIDIDGCRHVLVDSCIADCNDDGIVMKTTCPIGNDDIEIRNCTVGTYSRAIKIGTETFGPTSNVYVHDCNVIYSTHGPYGAHSPGMCGINLAAVNGGSLQNIRVENITMTGIEAGLCIRLGASTQQYTSTVPAPGPGFVDNVELKNITATVTSDTTSSITGIPGYNATNISLQNIDVTFPGGWPTLAGNFVVPENIAAAPQATIFGDSLPAAGLYCRHLDSLQLINVCFHALQPDGRPDFWMDDVANLDTSGICGTIAIRNVPSGIFSPDFIAGMNLFPNPVTNGIAQLKIPVEFSEGTIRLTDLTGQVLRELTMTGSTQLLDVNDLASGFYIIRIENRAVQASCRFVKL